MKYIINSRFKKTSWKAEKSQNEGRMNEEWRMMKDEGWILKEDDFKLLRGFDYGQTE